jgi:hypothetical protein
VNNQHEPSFLCVAKLIAAPDAHRTVPLLPETRAMCALSHQKRSGIVKTKSVSAGVDITAILPLCAWATCEAI